MEEMVNIFQNKRVLVTGHTGFKGSWISLWLLELGADVIGFSRDFPSEPNLFSEAKITGRLKHHEGDICNFEAVKKVFSETKPDYVFHLAAQALVRLSYQKTKETFDTNVGGLVNVLECVRQTPSVRFFLNVTSDKCYENKEWMWGYRETDRLGGKDPYSASKAVAEIVTQSYQQSFFPTSSIDQHRVDVLTVRAGNVVGGGDWNADRLIPDAIRSLSKNEIILIRNPKSVRPWQHVLDCLGGYLLLASKALSSPGVYTGGWNFGPGGNLVTVEEVVEKILKGWGEGSWQKMEQEKDKGEASLLHLNCDKAMNLLKWSPVWNLDATIDKTVQWYRQYYQNPSQAYSLCQTQIREFMKDQDSRKVL